MRENCGDAAIGCVESKREASKRVVRGRIWQEHRVRSKANTADVMLDEEEEKIVTASCKY
jgi:hypothetical protein